MQKINPDDPQNWQNESRRCFDDHCAVSKSLKQKYDEHIERVQKTFDWKQSSLREKRVWEQRLKHLYLVKRQY